jgi:pimeloyl-ACP methyl ester carboxylesterase
MADGGGGRRRLGRRFRHSVPGDDVRTTGPGTTSPPVLLVHGSHPADDLLPLTRAFARVGFETSLLQRLPALTVVEQAEHAAETVRGAAAGAMHVVGHSFGALVALQLAADRPDLVRSLTLIEPSLMTVASGALFLTRLRRVGPPALVPDLPSLLGWEFTDGDAARVQAPVLSVVTRPTRRVFLEGRAQIHAWFPWAEDLDVDGRGHLGVLDNPVATANGIARFISNGRRTTLPAPWSGPST